MFLLVSANCDMFLLFGANYVMESDMLASASVWWLLGAKCIQRALIRQSGRKSFEGFSD